MNSSCCEKTKKKQKQKQNILKLRKHWSHVICHEKKKKRICNTFIYLEAKCMKKHR